MATPPELDAMRLAIAVSARGLGSTSPNPPVGCVILALTGEVVGIGHHERKGESHAEVRALQHAGDRARGGTAVVTLEPCNHFGRTPACRQALLDAGIARVLIALLDPTSRGAGGAAVLHAAGIDVELDILADEARVVLGPWLHALATGRPWTIAAWGHDGHRHQPLNDTTLTQLRTDVDVILQDGGQVEEAIPGAHGHHTLHLPNDPLPDSDDPSETLTALYAAGARTVLLHVAPDTIDRYAKANLIDRGLVYLAGQEPEDLADPAAVLIPPGLRLTSIGRADNWIRIEAIPRFR
jgi:diaminohydroxyphosphoribosylaminopyrimidine deaminase / 5-amino-6-(5-phosphoribosylamino)uracil reductase